MPSKCLAMLPLTTTGLSINTLKLRVSYYFIPVLLPVLVMHVNGHKCHTDVSMSDYSPMQPIENISSKLTM